jgi:hypothetical protein
MSFLAGTKFPNKDLRNVLVEDTLKNDRIKIKLIQKNDELGDTVWREKQQQLYPYNINIYPEATTEQEILTQDNEQLLKDQYQAYQKAEYILLSLTKNEKTVQFVLDHLETPEIQFFVSQSSYITSELKKRYVRLTKNILVNFIKSQFRLNPADVEPDLSTMKQDQAAADERKKTRERQEMVRKARVEQMETKQKAVKDARLKLAVEAAAVGKQKKAQKALEKLRDLAEKVKNIDKRKRAVQNKISPSPLRPQQLDWTGIGEESMTPPVEKPKRGRKPKSILEKTILALQKVNAKIQILDGYDNRTKRQNNTLFQLKDSRTSLENQIAALEKYQKVEATGKGLNKKKLIRGGGMPQDQTNKKEINGKFKIDLNKLKNQNLLSIKYAKNNATLPHFKPVLVNNDVKSIILDLVATHHINEQFFNKLPAIDKRIIQRFIKVTKIFGGAMPLVETDDDTDFNKRFQILRSEYNAGNDSEILKKELKQYTLQALQEGAISNRDAMMLLYQLSL